MRNMTLREVSESQAKVQAARRSITLFNEGLLTQAELSFRSGYGRLSDRDGWSLWRSWKHSAHCAKRRMGYYKATVGFMQNLADLERVIGKDLQ